MLQIPSWVIPMSRKAESAFQPLVVGPINLLGGGRSPPSTARQQLAWARLQLPRRCPWQGGIPRPGKRQAAWMSCCRKLGGGARKPASGVLGHAPLRRAADRRHGAARRPRSPTMKRPAKAKPWWPACRPTSTPHLARGARGDRDDYLARSMPEGWARCIAFLALLGGAESNRYKHAPVPSDGRNYGCDITYATKREPGASELILREQTCPTTSEEVYTKASITASIDEVDLHSGWMKPRTPLIISRPESRGPGKVSTRAPRSPISYCGPKEPPKTGIRPRR